MSEHDEPKTALTGLLTEHMLILAPAPAITRCLCGADAGERMSLRAARWWFAAHLADVLLAEGYTTTPAPEAVETVEWGVRVVSGGLVSPDVKYPEAVARRCVANLRERLGRPGHPGYYNGRRFESATLISRTRISYAPRVTEWVPVDRGADGHEEGEQ